MKNLISAKIPVQVASLQYMEKLVSVKSSVQVASLCEEAGFFKKISSGPSLNEEATWFLLQDQLKSHLYMKKLVSAKRTVQVASLQYTKKLVAVKIVDPTWDFADPVHLVKDAYKMLLTGEWI